MLYNLAKIDFTTKTAEFLNESTNFNILDKQREILENQPHEGYQYFITEEGTQLLERYNII